MSDSVVWTWVLADANNVTIREITTASAKKLSFKRNAPATASCTIDHEDDLAQFVIDNYVASGPPILRAYRRGPMDSAGVLRFSGHLAPAFAESCDVESGRMEMVFQSPFARLLGASNRYARWTDAEIVATAQDQGTIAAELIRLYGGVYAAGVAGSVFTGASANGEPVGLDIGSIEATVTRDRTYTYANVGEAITNLSNVLDGFDFDETFQDDDGRTIALFNVYAEQGADLPAVRFEYGASTLNNCRAFSRTTSPPVNYVRVNGAAGLTAAVSDPASIAHYGRFDRLETASQVVDTATLEDRGQAVLRPDPIKTVKFTPEMGLSNCPRPWDDYWLGDTVGVYARHFALVEEARARVNSIDVVIDDEGNESAEIEDPSLPGAEGGLRSAVAVEVV